MRKIALLLSGFAAPFYFSQQAGDVFSTEQKLNLTPQGVLQFISNNLGEQNAPDFVNYLKGFNLGLKAYKVTYYTKNEKNILVKATGLIMYPNVNYKLSTVVSDHGTTDSRNNVPSNLKGAMAAGFVVELSYALNGYILMAPDYVGMGSGNGVHPYLHAPTEASATIDFVTAANKVLAQLGIKRYNEYFLTGYSQGGHAGMSTLKKLSTSNPTNLNFKHAYLGAGPYDLSGSFFQKGIVEKQDYLFSPFIATLVNTCNNIGYKTYNNNISEVVSAEYMDKYNYHVVQDHGGMLWGPLKWRKLFTNNFVNNVTTNQNNKLRQCLRLSDDYNWYNKTPTTLGHSSVDLVVHPQNTSKTLQTQRGYYAWWDLNKYKLQEFYWGPVGHVVGFMPYILASNAKFNTLRSGGFFNQWAKLNSKNESDHPSKINDIYSSQIKPDLQGKELISITDFNKENIRSKSVATQNISDLNDGAYLLKISENNENKFIPYIKNTPATIPENEIVKSELNNILSLKIDQEELSAIHIFDENKNLVKTVSQEQYAKNDGIDLDTLDHQNYTFEIVTQFYNLQFKKKIGDATLNNNLEIFTKNRQIIIKAKNDLKSISIYSISGALLQKQEINQSQFESNNLELGVYVVQITQTNGKTISKKVKL